MSVINQMLKDLDKRRIEQQAPRAVDFSHLHVASRDEDEIPWQKYLGMTLIFLFSVSMIVVAWYYWPTLRGHFSLPHFRTKASLVASSATVNVSVPSATVATQPVAPAKAQEPVVDVQRVVVPLTSEQEVEQQYQEALTAISQNNTDEAINELRTLLDKSPDFNQGRVALADLLYKENRYNEAASVLNTGLNLAPGYLPFVELQAHVLQGRGDPDGALAILKTAKPDINEHQDYYAMMAAIEQQLGKHEDAAHHYNDLIQVDPTNGRYWLGLGIALESIHDTKAAIEAYQKAEFYDDGLPDDLQHFVHDRLSALES